MSEPARWRWLESAALAAHAMSWPTVWAITVLVAGILAYRLLAERQRRNTLRMSELPRVN